MVCINQFRTEKVIDVFRTIQKMRGQRPGIVGNMVRPLYIVTSDCFIRVYIAVGPVQIHSQNTRHSVAAILLINSMQCSG